MIHDGECNQKPHASKIQSPAEPVHQIHVLMQYRKDQRALFFPEGVEHV
jgi:hypothetical protein